ncbi:MAG: hypothetical protein M3209_18905 [Acidobacteriota bacterium]|nr:hypothetical protein [Acidobacteriota bacterium]
MPAVIVAVIFFIISLLPANAFGQEQNSQQRTQEIVAEFNKTKHKVKEKKGFRVEVYVETRSEAAVKRPEEYSGVYRIEGASLELRVSANGAVEGKGVDSEGRHFTLTNGRIEGALLTATKTYAGSGSEKFEGVFINLTVRSGKSPADAVENGTKFGLGVVGQLVAYGDRIYGDRVFYERR